MNARTQKNSFTSFNLSRKRINDKDLERTGGIVFTFFLTEILGQSFTKKKKNAWSTSTKNFPAEVDARMFSPGEQ